MFYKKQVKILFFSLVLLLASISFFVFQANQPVLAHSFDVSSKAGHNFSGYAWSENYGWISFNSSNCDADDSGGSDGVIPGCPSSGTVVADYGVNVNYRDGKVSGHAWSSNIGWISFKATAGANVVYDKTTGRLSGTAKIVSLVPAGDGDLVFDGTATNSSHFGVETDISDELLPAYGKLTGYAWNENNIANTGMGWLKFNGTATMSGNDYEVVVDLNKTPVVNNSKMWRTWPSPSEQVLPDDGGGANLEVSSIGDTVEFRVDWSDDPGDYARLFICDDNSGIDTSFGLLGATNNQNSDNDGINNWDCNGNTLCGASINQMGDPAVITTLSCSKTLLAGDFSGAGANKKYYATVCDAFGYCKNLGASDSFLLNDRPTVTSIDTTGPNNVFTGSPSEITIGGTTYPLITTPPLSASPDPYNGTDDSTLYFKADWADSYPGGSMTMYICKTDESNFIYDHTANQGCASGEELCHDTEFPGDGTIECSSAVNVSAGGINNYYVFMCDGYGACTKTAAHGQFYANQRPVVGSGMSAPNWDASQAAGNDEHESDLQATLKWTLTDADGTVLTDAYIDFNKDNGTDVMDGFADPSLNPLGASYNNDFGSSLGDICTGAGHVDCSLTIKDAGYGSYPKRETLEWGTSYSFTVSVRDEYAWSEPRQYHHNGGTDVLTDDGAGYGHNLNQNINNALSATPDFTFTTYKHNFPVANANVSHLTFPVGAPKGITYFPEVPSAGEAVKAYPHSYRYDDGNPPAGKDAVSEGNARECTVSSPGCIYNVVIDDDPTTGVGEVTNDPASAWGGTLANANNPFYIRFFNYGNSATQQYEFTVIDSDDGYFCTDNPATIDSVNKSLPSWKEVK